MVKPLNIGIWLPLPPGSHWSAEGIARTIEFILGGLKKNGDLGTGIVFTFFATKSMAGEISRSLHETIGDDVRHIHFAAPMTADYRALKIVNFIFSLGGLIRFKKGDPKPFKIEKLAKIKSESGVRRFYRKGKAFKAARFLGLGDLIGQDLDDYQFPKKKSRWQKLKARFGEKSGDSALAPIRPFEQYRYEERYSLKYTMPGAYVFQKIVETFDEIWGLRFFSRKARGAYIRLASRSTNQALLKEALSQNFRQSIDGWWVINPNIYGAEFLPGPKIVNFWDFVVGEYGYYWNKNTVANIHARVKLVCHAGDAIITQSHHNRDLKLGPVIGISADKVDVVYLSYPDHYPQYVSGFESGGERTPQSRAEAANIIRHYAAWRLYQNYGNRAKDYHRAGFMLERINKFEFENTCYAIVSTQDRPYKNLSFVINAFFDAVNKKGLDAYLFLTSEVDLSNSEKEITKTILKQRAQHRIFSLPRVPNKIHAALYHCAALTIHPSYTEGGVGSYPFVEGMVMGCPGLVAIGDYSREGQRLHPDYKSLMISPFYKKDARNKILTALRDPAATHAQQKPIFDVHARWQWNDVASAYLHVFRRTIAQAADIPANLDQEGKEIFYDFASGHEHSQ